MITNDGLNQTIQQPDVGAYVVLYKLDLTPIDQSAGKLYFTQSCYESSSVRFDGHTYTPIDIVAEGFEVNGRGTLPRPKMRIANVALAMSSAVIAWNDILGAIVTRIRTLRKYLDGESDADPNAFFPPDIYVVERKTAHTKVAIEWELSAILDYEGVKLPRRQILRDYCCWIYRRYIDDAFDYTYADCPYTGTSYYDALGQITTIDKDVCGKRISDCQLRFPGKQILPTASFPGVARARVR